MIGNHRGCPWRIFQSARPGRSRLPAIAERVLACLVLDQMWTRLTRRGTSSSSLIVVVVVAAVVVAVVVVVVVVLVGKVDQER